MCKCYIELEERKAKACLEDYEGFLFTNPTEKMMNAFDRVTLRCAHNYKEIWITVFEKYPHIVKMIKNKFD